MKYKLVLWNNGGGSDNDVPLANFTFYTRAQAEQAAGLWTELGSNFRGYLWDGSTWTLFQP